MRQKVRFKDIETTKFYKETNKKEKLKHPPNHSEFEVQSYIFSELKKFDFDVRGEVHSADRKCRFDLVVYHNFKPKIVIEVKKSVKVHKKVEKIRNFKQACKYASYCNRVYYVRGMKEARKFVDGIVGMRVELFRFFKESGNLAESI